MHDDGCVDARASRARAFLLRVDERTTNDDERDATRRFYRGFASHRGGDDDDDGFDDGDGFDEQRDERGP